MALGSSFFNPGVIYAPYIPVIGISTAVKCLSGVITMPTVMAGGGGGASSTTLAGSQTYSGSTTYGTGGGGGAGGNGIVAVGGWTGPLGSIGASGVIGSVGTSGTSGWSVLDWSATLENLTAPFKYAKPFATWIIEHSTIQLKNNMYPLFADTKQNALRWIDVEAARFCHRSGPNTFTFEQQTRANATKQAMDHLYKQFMIDYTPVAKALEDGEHGCDLSF